MTDENYQSLGLIGFVISGVFFLVSGVQAGDGLTIAGSGAWIVACLAWGMPLYRAKRVRVGVEAGSPNSQPTDR